MDFSLIENMTPPQQVMLSVMAYLMDFTNKRRLISICKRVEPNMDQAYKSALGKLYRRGYVYSDDKIFSDYLDSDYSINEKYVIYTLMYLLQEQSGWYNKLTSLEGIDVETSDLRKAVIGMLTDAMAGKKVVIPTRVDKEELADIMMPIYIEPSYSSMTDNMPMELFEIMLPNMIPDYQFEYHPEKLERCIALARSSKKRKSASWSRTIEDMLLINYMYTGQVSEGFDRLLTPQFHACIEVFRLASAGEYVEASQQLQQHCMLPDEIYSDYALINFLYVLLLANINDEPSLNELKKYCRGKYLDEETTRMASLFAIMYAKPDTETVSIMLADEFRMKSADTAPKFFSCQMAHLLCQWGKISETEINQQLNSNIYVPDRFNGNTYICQLFTQLLSQCYVKPSWLRVIEKVMQQEDCLNQTLEHPVVVNDARDQRFAYFYSGRNDSVELRLQKRLKSGKWGSGVAVNLTALLSDNKAERDEYDMRIVSSLDNVKIRFSSYYMLRLQDVLPMLEGSDKFYYGSSAPYHHCLIREDQPVLEAKIGRNDITLSSNIPLDQLKNAQADSVFYSIHRDMHSAPDAVYTAEAVYYHVPARICSYLSALLTVGTFPLEAEESLRPLLDRIKKYIEIHSEMIEGGSSLPQVEGNPQVYLQMRSVHGNYEMRALCRPMPEGRITVAAGKGDTNIYDTAADGTRYHVVRNKKQERQNMQPLRDYMEQIECDEVSQCMWVMNPYTLLTLLEWLPEQGDDYIVEWPEGEKVNVRVAQSQQWNLQLRRRGDWFEVEGEVPIDDQTIVSFAQLLDMIEEGHGRFIRLQNGDYLSMSESLRRQLRRIDAVAQNVRGHARISNVGASLIADAMQGDLSISHPAELDALRSKIVESQDLQADVPDTLNATLRDYQLEGFRWMDRLTYWGAGACLADDMGLGKTIQTIAYLLYKQSDGPSMVVAPASVVPNWKKELARFAPTLQVCMLNELASAERSEAVAQATSGCVVLTTYGLLISEEESVVAKQWNVVCLDEAHSIKNATTKTSAVCMQLQAHNRLILTGTPIQNHLGELWNLFQFINPGLLGSLQQFTQKYINPIEGAHNKERQQQLKRIIQPFMLRRTKQEVVSELPDKQEIMLPVELSTEEMGIYEMLRLKAKSQLETEVAGALSVNTLALITQLRMAACAASLAQKQWKGKSSKLTAFCDLVSEISSTGNRVLVFSQFTSFLEMAQAELKARGMRDYLYLDGSTPLKKRSQMVEDFQHGKCPIFIISLKAGGLGLNLTGANYVIHLDPWWNPAIEQQATDRAYRIGQNQKVTVYHLISSHTIEEKIVRLHQTKRDLADSLLEGTDVSHKLRAEDLLEMING
ncbi:MAG: DEAD/DEAH box helicase [Bacteroidales bacterium]|nr:DEAD/DEAH box helicase [Bacteroidales bacterium]